jgi:hypothetical protein
VIQVPVGEQHGGRRKPVLRERLLELIEHADTRIDHKALLPRTGGDHIAVGAEGLGRKAGDEHGGNLSANECES